MKEPVNRFTGSSRRSTPSPRQLPEQLDATWRMDVTRSVAVLLSCDPLLVDPVPVWPVAEPVPPAAEPLALPLPVEPAPVEPAPVDPAPVADEPVPPDMPERFSVPRTSTWLFTCFCMSD